MDGEYLELISLNIWHIIVTIANLLILALIIKKILWERVKKVVAERQGQVDDIYRYAEEALDQAEHDKKLYGEKIAGAKEEADSIVKAAVQRADRLGDEIIADAKVKAADTMKKAEAEIEQEKKKAMNELKNEVAEISVQIAESVVGREITEDDHRDLIDSFIEKL
ncbi:MAG: F0F1 ATP synthase subunit B [Clostridia bacterium]|nr:F0F1 ATP synthase subunit B [Clostridia bacterium]